MEINEEKNEMIEDTSDEKINSDAENKLENDEVIVENLDESKKIMVIDSDELFRLQKKLKRSFNKNIILTIFCIICVIIFLAEGMLAYYIYQKNEGFFNTIINTKEHEERNESTESEIATVSETAKELDINAFAEKLSYVEYLVNNAFYYDKTAKQVEDGMFTGYIDSLKDKYAQYFPKQEFSDFVQQSTGEYYGIGAVCTQNFESMEAMVTEVYEDSPADKAGVKIGDIFKTVDGVDVAKMELNDIVAMIKGEEGTPVKLGMYRESEKGIVELTAYRGKVEIKNVTSKIYEDNIGYLKLNEFNGKALEQFKTHMEKLENENVKGVIIDLRNNPGGELSIVLNMVDYIMKDNDGKYTLNQKEDNFDIGKTLVVYMKDKYKIVESFYCNDKHEVNIPIVVLVNESSASASELFTRCLMDYNKAVVVGTKTYGKGVVQNMIPLNDGSAVKFTVSEYFSPSGYSINKHGVIPDYCIDEFGDEVIYDNEGKIIEDEELSENNNKEENVVHEENKKIYDDKNEWIQSEWFSQMDTDYEDKQLLQAIMVLK